MKTKLIQTALTFAALALFTLLGTSCGTARGFGRDLGTVGHGIERVAR
jgi:predicted small secreted protein